MRRYLASSVALGVTLATSLATVTRDASACSLPPAGWYLFNNAGSAPVNGVLVMNYTCHYECEVIPDPMSFTLTDASGTLVPGEVVMSGEADFSHYVVFRPEPGALAVGEAYTAAIQGAASAAGILADSEVTWSATIAQTNEMFELDHPAGDTVTCSGPLDSCGGVPEFRTMVDRKIAIWVLWGNESQPDTLTQYAYRLLQSDDVDPETPWNWNGGSTGFELADTEASRCYVLELKRLTDGFVHTFDERCIERPEDFEPGLHPAPSDTIDGALATCETPPEGYEGRWCGLRADMCLPNDDPWCTNYAEYCLDGGSGGAPNVGGSGGSSGAAGTTGGSGGSSGSGAQGGSSGSGGAGSGGAQAGTGGSGEAGGPDDGDDGGGERVYTKGCGCSVPRTNTTGRGALTLALFGVAALASRRRSGAA